MRRAAPSVALVVATFLRAAPAGGADAPTTVPEIVLDRDGVVVTSSVRVRPGVYRVADDDGDGVLQVRGAGLVVDLTGVELVGAADDAAPDGLRGVGIAVEGGEGVTVRGGAVRGFAVGLRARRAPRLTVEGLDASGNRRDRLRSTPDREDPSDWLWPHENDDGQWEARYGAGLSLSACPGARVARCRVRGGQNGLLLAACDGATVTGNDCSFNSGWGIALWRTSDAALRSNRCDFCVRGYSHGVYARGQDSTGFLVFEQCHRNRFVGNSATHSGDGFFLYAGHETLQRTGKGGCDHNVVVGNDFSHAVANAIEATFSTGNRFEHNRLDDADHGVWAGYSSETTVLGNRFAGCANGVSIEHGRGNLVRWNSFDRCGVGVRLWWDDDADLAATVWGRAHDLRSSGNLVEANRLTDCVRAVVLEGDAGSSLRGNEVVRAREGFVLRAGTSGTSLAGNRLDTEGPSLLNETTTPVDATDDAWRRVEGALVGPGAAATRPWAAWKGPTASVRHDGPASGPEPSPAFLPADAPRGRAQIAVGPWGPLDPRRPDVVPRVAAPAAAVRLRVVGAGLPFEVTGLPAGVEATPRRGTAPAFVSVAAAGDGPSVRPWSATVNVGSTAIPVSGTATFLAWTVEVAPWRGDPRTDAEALSRALADPAVVTFTAPGLAFSTGGAFGEGLPRDRFVTRATARLTLPAGAYRLTVTSDDGIRVRLDGKVLFEDWTWHGPKDDVVLLDLSDRPHTLVLEHFEIDGHAALGCVVEPGAGRR